MILHTIISGGQTGVDQTALEVAQLHGYETGGTAPKGYRTDDGPAVWLKTKYGLKESSARAYSVRTFQNVRDAHATVWFGTIISSGYECTYRAVLVETRRRQYFWLVNPTAEDLRQWLEENPIGILNVAGNRRSTHPESMIKARPILVEALRRD